MPSIAADLLLVTMFLLLVSLLLMHSGSSLALRKPPRPTIGTRRQLFFIGGYSEEIVVAALDKNEARMHKIASFASGKSPSILALHPSKHILYAANEVQDGAVEAFAYDPIKGTLSPLGKPVSTAGDGPAAISVDPTGEFLLFANYGGGSYGVTAIDPSTGELHGKKPVTLVKVPSLRSRPSTNPRQHQPHPHQIITQPCTGTGSTANFIFVCDLGTDEIHLGKLDAANGALHRNFLEATAEVEVEIGSGPRHMIFSHDKRFAYVINELANSVHQFAYDPATGSLRFINGWSTLDDTVVNKTVCAAAELALSPDGRFLYASNRGNEQDTMAVFCVDSESGELNLLGLDLVGGSGPRHFALDASGEVVVVALQNSNKITLLQRDESTGRLSLVATLDEGVQAPTYIQFLRY